MSTREMVPLIVTMTGSISAQTKMAALLKKYFSRRGFKVGLRSDSNGTACQECDILLIPFQPQNVKSVAGQIEQEWTKNWLAWYSLAKSKSEA